MAKSKSLPDHAILLTTYRELHEYASAFALGHLSFVLVLGAAGIGKSRAFRDGIGDDACWIEGNASPYGIYQAAYQHRNQPIVLDDVDGLHRDRQGIRLLKSLCQTDKVKSISWHTNGRSLEAAGIPNRFETRSPIALIANNWTTANSDVVALEDRAHLLHFDPAPMEIHRHAAQWFWDPEIFAFIDDHLHLVARHSLRCYYIADEQKAAGLDWRANFLSRCLQGTALAVAKLKIDANFASEADRVQAFVEAGHGSRATYFNHSRELRHSVQKSAQERICLSLAPSPLLHNNPPLRSPIRLNVQ